MPLAPLGVTAKLSVVVEPAAPSDMPGEEIEAVGGSSSSVMVSVASAGFATPLAPLAVAETVTVLSGASLASSFAATVTTPALAVSPAATVSAAPVCVRPSPDAETVSVTAALDSPDSAAVGSVSSSLSVGVAPVSVPAPWPLPSVTVTVTLRFALPWWTSSSAAVTSTVSEAAAVDPAAMTMVVSDPTV